MKHTLVAVVLSCQTALLAGCGEVSFDKGAISKTQSETSTLPTVGEASQKPQAQHEAKVFYAWARADQVLLRTLNPLTRHKRITDSTVRNAGRLPQPGPARVKRPFSEFHVTRHNRFTLNVMTLPQQMSTIADLRGAEHGWRVDQVPAVLDLASQNSLASLGGQFQFRLPDGSTCEMYWLSADSTERQPNESRDTYVMHSVGEV